MDSTDLGFSNTNPPLNWQLATLSNLAGQSMWLGLRDIGLTKHQALQLLQNKADVSAALRISSRNTIDQFLSRPTQNVELLNL